VDDGGKMIKLMRVKLLHLENDFEIQNWEHARIGWMKFILCGNKIGDKEIRYFLIPEKEVLWIDVILSDEKEGK